MKETIAIFLTSIALTGLLLACGPRPIPHIPPDTAQCSAACENLRAIGCEEGEPLSDGTSCEKFCVDTQNSGHWLNPTCVKDITSCDDIEACGEH